MVNKDRQPAPIYLLYEVADALLNGINLPTVRTPLLFIRGYSRLEEDGVCPVLRVQQRVVSVHPGKEVDALMPLLNRRLK